MSLFETTGGAFQLRQSLAGWIPTIAPCVADHRFGDLGLVGHGGFAKPYNGLEDPVGGSFDVRWRTHAVL
jgi:hypothetical protein